MQTNDVEAKILIEIPEVSLHRLINKTKNLVSTGTMRVCELEKPNKEKVYFINLNSFYYTINKETLFVKVPYKRNVSFVYPHFDNGLGAITVPNGSLVRLEEILTEVAMLLNYDQATVNPILSERITAHYPTLKTEQIVVTDQVDHIIQETGRVAEVGLKWIGGWLSTGIEKIGGYIGDKVQPTGQTDNSRTAENTWTKVKDSTSNFFRVSSEYVAAILDPVVAKGKQAVQSIGQKIDSSQNPNVKYMKQLGGTAAGAVKQAFNGVVVAATQVGTSVSKTTKELWQKKYGGPPLNEPIVSKDSKDSKDSLQLHENIDIDKDSFNKSTTSESEPLIHSESAYPSLDK